MVKSTIDDIKDITLERQIRKLAGVIDKQNEVIESVGDVDDRITAVEDSTANNTVQINSVKEDVSKNTIAIENISNRVTNVEESTEAIPGIQTEINGINQSLVSDVVATFDNNSRELKISVEREASTPIDATVVIPASSETGQYSEGNGIKIQDYQISVDTEVVALKTDIPIVPDISQLTADVEQAKTDIQTINTEITGITNDITNVNNKNTEQDTAISGKVAIAQGVENAGKSLVVGDDGNVTLGTGGSGGGNVTIGTISKEELSIAYSKLKVGDIVSINNVGTTSLRNYSFIGVISEISGAGVVDIWGSGYLKVDNSVKELVRVKFSDSLYWECVMDGSGDLDSYTIPFANIFLYNNIRYYSFT